MSKLKYFAHPQSIVESTTIGERTRIWAFAHVLPGAVIGDDCNICDNVFIENDTKIGHRVTIKCGVQIWDGIELEDDVFIGPNVTFTNDRFPRSKVYPTKFSKTIVHQGASIGANATILPGLKIGSQAMIGAGSVVTKDIPSAAIVVGNPAKIIGYTDQAQSQKKENINFQSLDSFYGAKLCLLPVLKDLCGMLTFTELPFSVKYYTIIHHIISDEMANQYACRHVHEFLICIRGSCKVFLDNGKSQTEIKLDKPTVGLQTFPMTWKKHYQYSSDCILLVLASDIYKFENYIQSYQEFQNELKR